MGFTMPKKKQGAGKFKPKIIASIIGSIIFASIIAYTGNNVLSGNESVIEGVAYDIKGDFYLMIFAIGFLVGFMYWGIANMFERKKVRAKRDESKNKKSNQHKKRSKEK